MDEQTRAAEHLRVIRGLMERVTIYRAISAPTALLGGVLALGLAICLYYAANAPQWAAYASSRNFVFAWLVLLVVVLAANAVFVWRQAIRDGRPFFSSGMRMTIRAVAPCLLIPAAATIWFLRQGFLGNNELLLVTCWIAFYGLALLSTAFFAPRSLSLLGWIFLLTSLFVPTMLLMLEDLPSYQIPNFLMGLTFGLYHLVYAACTWSRFPPARPHPASVE